MPADRDSRADCLFCRIVRGELPAKTIVDDELVLAFHDIAPRSPTHVLVIPKVHIPSAADLTEADGPLLGRLFATLARIAREDHPNIVLETGDVAIFSSRIIPGNEKAINRLQNALIRLGATPCSIR